MHDMGRQLVEGSPEAVFEPALRYFRAIVEAKERRILYSKTFEPALRYFHAIVEERGEKEDKVRSKQATCFFRLPSELRNQVYHEIWKDTPQISSFSSLFVVAYDGHVDSSEKRYQDRRAPGLPLWLLANKHMLREGLGQLMLKGKLAMEGRFTPFHRQLEFIRPWETLQSLSITGIPLTRFTDSARKTTLRVGDTADYNFRYWSKFFPDTKIRELSIEFVASALQDSPFATGVQLPDCIAGLLSVLESLETITIVESFHGDDWKRVPWIKARKTRLESLQNFLRNSVYNHGRIVSGEAHFSLVEEDVPPTSMGTWGMCAMMGWTYQFRKRPLNSDDSKLS